MSVEQLIRESMSAFAETIEPDPAWSKDVEVPTPPNERRVSWVRYAPAAVAAAAVIVLVAVQVLAGGSRVIDLVPATSGPDHALGASFTSAGGRWSFDYPKDWTLRERDASSWLVYNFAAERISPEEPLIYELPGDGEILIRWGITPAIWYGLQAEDGQAMNSTQEVFDRFCAGPGPYPAASPEKFSLLECNMTQINGRYWVVWLGALGDARVYEASAVFNGKFYRANATVGAGGQLSELLDVTRKIFDTFELQPGS